MSAPVHQYSFEVWPDPLPTATYPILLPGRVTVRAGDPETARSMAAQQIQAGQALGACAHWRGRCTPPHPGRD